ncbi:MAG TPA: hypothetical protein VGJ91_24330 [Polyangiaceae bacterium]
MKIASGCPDMSTIDAVSKIKFADEFSLDAKVAEQVKAGVIASDSLRDLAASIDADLKTGCSGLAKDLGAVGEFKTGVEACKAAGKAMADSKAKMGATLSVTLDVKEPVCSVSLGAVSDCASKCDASLKGGKAEVKCEGGEVSGKCDGNCSGKCELSAPASCAGTCDGSCDADFSGACSGVCDGTCDSKKATKGSCSGKCEGKCDAKGKGECSGKCSGSCQLSGSAKCEGTCTGTCSVEFKQPLCSGTAVPPKMSGDCKASCDANASANLSCTPAVIAVKISGTKDLELAAKYKAALEANLPRIIKVVVGMVPKLTGVVGNAEKVIQGGIAAGQAAAKGRATAAAHIGQCLVTPFQDALAAVGNVKATVQVSVDVKAEASGSGSASSKG